MSPPSENFGAAGDVDPKKQGATGSSPRGRSGDRPSLNLKRLLHSAAQVGDDAPIEVPFGFDTRVVAQWRAGLPNGNHGLARFIQRVAGVAVFAIIISTAAMIYETDRDRESSEPYGNEFAIADSAIESELPQ